MSEMTMRTLSPEAVRTVYDTYLKAYFPANERKPLAMIERELARETYICLGFYTGADLAGFAFIAFRSGFHLLDYFAVSESLRGQGVGSACMRLLAERFADAACFVIETESPETAADAASREMRLRRNRFYLRNGCVDSGVRAQVFGVEYSLFTLPTAWSKAEIRAAYGQYYRSILPGIAYLLHIRVK